MALTLTQNEIERELADVVPHGTRKEIARLTHTYESVMYGYMNSDDERKSPAFNQLAIQAALDEIAPELGEVYWQKFCALREASRPHPFKTGRTIADSLTDKITRDASTTTQLVDALRDGHIDLREASKILISVNAERRNLDEIEQIISGSVN